MAISATNLTTFTSNQAGTYVTSSISPSTNALILASVMMWPQSGGPSTGNPTSVTGNGLTWVQIGTYQAEADGLVIGTIWRAMGTPSAGAVTANFSVSGFGCNIMVDQFTGTDTSGTNGSGAIVQSVYGTGTSRTLAALGSANNAAFGFCARDSSNGIAAGSGFTQLGGSSITWECGLTEWQLNVTTVNATPTGGGGSLMMAVEIKADTGGGTAAYAAYYQQYVRSLVTGVAG